MKGERQFRVQHVTATPRGWKVRTVVSGAHRVRVAFPPGRRQTGSGQVVEILHPRGENPCRTTNPAELLLMGANPMRSQRADPYDSLSQQDKLAFGRLGLGKAQLQSRRDIQRARRLADRVHRERNRFPNPAAEVSSPEAEAARDLRERFTDHPSKGYSVDNEPHIPAGDYALLGELLDLGVLPTETGEARTQMRLTPEGEDVQVISSPDGKIYFANDGQGMTDAEIRVFTDSAADRVLLGECRTIAYFAAKYHPQVPASVRGKVQPWEHRFGEERGGHPPLLYYLRRFQRWELEGGTYTVEGVGIKN